MDGRFTSKQLLAEIFTRANRMANGGFIVDQSREMQRKMAATLDDLQKLWKSGKPVQRRQQTVLNPLAWQAATGIEPEKLDIGVVTDPEDLIHPGGARQWNQLLQVITYSLLPVMNSPTATGDEVLAGIQVPLLTLFIYMSARRFGAPSVFELREGLAEKLILTDADQIRPDDVQVPLPGFYVEMPPNALEMWNRHTGWHKVSLVGMAEAFVQDGPRQGRTAVAIFWGEPNEKSTNPADDNAQVAFVTLPIGYQGSVEQHEVTIREDAEFPSPTRRRPFVRWQGTEFSFEDGHRFLRKFVMNFCLYLSSPNPDIEPTGAKQTWRETVEKAESARAAGPHAKRQVTIGKNFSLWDVGRKVARITREMTATDILVRGFWRRQVHGPARSLRKVMWIEPFVRRPTGGDASHDYAVKGDGELEKNDRANQIADATREVLRPILGAALAKDVAGNAAMAFAFDEEPEEPFHVTVRSVLMQRLRNATTYRAEHLTEEMVDEAVAAVEAMGLT